MDEADVPGAAGAESGHDAFLARVRALDGLVRTRPPGGVEPVGREAVWMREMETIADMVDEASRSLPALLREWDLLDGDLQERYAMELTRSTTGDSCRRGSLSSSSPR
jgi:hypothetical protein